MTVSLYSSDPDDSQAVIANVGRAIVDRFAPGNPSFIMGEQRFSVAPFSRTTSSMMTDSGDRFVCVRGLES